MTATVSGNGALGRGHQRGLLRGQVGGEGLPQRCGVDRELDRGLAARPGRILVLDQGRLQPCRCSRSMTPFQLDASAKAPCTSTIVGLTPACWDGWGVAFNGKPSCISLSVRTVL